MKHINKMDASAFNSIRNLAYAVSLVILLTILSVIFAYRAGILHWQEGLLGRDLDLVILAICAILLVAIFIAVIGRLVRARTAEKLLRSNLVQNEARLKSLFQTIPDMIWLKDENGVFLACNPAFERFFGAQEREIVGKTDYDFVDAELADFFRANDQRALAAGQATVNEEWVTLAVDDKRVLLETVKVPVRTGEGELIGVMGISRDITRRHLAEKDASLFRNLVEFSGDPVYMVDQSDYRMTYANQAACKHFGASQEEILNWRVFDWDPNITEADLASMREQFKVGGVVVFETHHRVVSGEIIPVEVSANDFMYDGKRFGAGYIRDIRERKKSEEALLQSQEQLRQLVAHQDRIREDERKRIAREIHDELGQYLLALRIDVSMLTKRRDAPQDNDEYVENLLLQIDGTMKNVRAIINNLRPSVLDLGLFAALEWQLKEFERRSGIACRLTGNEDDLHIGENLSTTLFRVMQEALTNVQRHANATLVSIDLYKEGDHLIMIVADNGIGIQQEEPVGNDRFGLMGIRERIAMLGGQATIENQDGTVLTISLPLDSSEGALKR